MCVCVLRPLSHVGFFVTLWMDCSPPGSSIYGIFQIKLLKWVSMPSSRGPSQPRNWAHISYVYCIGECALSLSHVQLFITPWNVSPAHQVPLFMGILQAWILGWVAMVSSRGSSQPRDWTQVSCIIGRLPSEPQGKPKNNGVDTLSLLQGIFPTQGFNKGLLQGSWILYQLSYQGSP